MNYYKITNKDEQHYQMKYHDGLNIDCEPWNPSGDCEPGGIYFSRKDILACLGIGCWLRQVTIPADAKVYENPGLPEKWKADRLFLHPREKITAKVVQRLIDEGADVNAGNGGALYEAAGNNQLAIVKVLLKAGADVNADAGGPLFIASDNGNLVVVKDLLKAGANVHADNDMSLYTATFSNRLPVVKVLLKAGAEVNYDMIYMATSRGHLAVVYALLKAASPATKEEWRKNYEPIII